MSATPQFHGRHAAILHQAGDTTERLVRQLTLLGCRATVSWRPLADTAGIDLVLADADEGWPGLLPWRGLEKPVPFVALLASEAPGRIGWALDQGADSLLPKPVMASAVYPALVMAVRRHEEATLMADTVATLRERIRLRPLVLAAVDRLRLLHGWSEDEGYRHLRREAMRQRVTLEQGAAAILADAGARRA